jgi:hypothetical protein
MIRATIVALHRIIRGRQGALDTTGSWMVVVTVRSEQGTDVFSRFTSTFADNRLGGPIFSWLAACDEIAQICSESEVSLELRMAAPVEEHLRGQWRAIGPRRRNPALHLDPVSVRLYRLEIAPRVAFQKHRGSSSWVVSLRGRCGRTRSKSFSDPLHGGPVFAWVAACDHLVEQVRQHPGIRVNRVPRPAREHVSAQGHDHPFHLRAE